MAELITLTGFSMHQRGDRRGHQQAHKVERLGLFALLSMEVPAAAHREVCAGRVSNHQIPAGVEHLFNGLLQVPARIGLAVEQVTAPCVVTAAAEGVTNAAAVFAGNQNLHP